MKKWMTRWQVPQESWGWRVLAVALIVVGLAPLGESIVRFIREKYGEDYGEFCRNVRRWWPRYKTVASGRTLNASLRCEGICGFH